jgi:hypothetical protein
MIAGSVEGSSDLKIGRHFGTVDPLREQLQVRMLVPERGEPTTKIGLFILFCIWSHGRYAGDVCSGK